MFLDVRQILRPDFQCFFTLSILLLIFSNKSEKERYAFGNFSSFLVALATNNLINKFGAKKIYARNNLINNSADYIGNGALMGSSKGLIKNDKTNDDRLYSSGGNSCSLNGKWVSSRLRNRNNY
ncbi:MAG: hypothetical protein N4A44_04955 [Alphaproteobacteria bacterium]|jgi:hypothetical protein|nr:hypothetical protein [Alphaproteobacteria bacterium]